ncbi:MAG: TatD family hydrolase [Spirochaetota bacterium]
MPEQGFVDAHIHFRDLFERDGGFPARFAGSGIEACAASHDPEEFLWTESLRAGGLSFATSFGIHPQSPGMDHAGFLSELAASGRIDVIGEAGFDFFGDLPERVRSPETEATQRRAFEFQLELAVGRSLPLLLHVRKGMDLVFEYTRQLAKLPAAIFHSWSGTPGEAQALLRKGVSARFSFGTTILTGRKQAMASLVELPAETLLSETDAPWQPPKGSPWCRFEDIGAVVAGMARLRDISPIAMNEAIFANWRAILGEGK